MPIRIDNDLPAKAALEEENDRTGKDLERMV